MEIEAILSGFDLIDGYSDQVRAKLKYSDGTIDTVRMSMDNFKQYMGERVSVVVAPRGSIRNHMALTAADTSSIAAEEEAPKRGRKPGQKNKAKLMDLNGNEIKNAQGKAFKSNGAYNQTDAAAILEAIKVGKHKVDPKRVYGLEWIVKYNSLAMKDEHGRKMTEAYADRDAKPEPVIEHDEAHESKGNKKSSKQQ